MTLSCLTYSPVRRAVRQLSSRLFLSSSSYLSLIRTCLYINEMNDDNDDGDRFTNMN